MANWNPQEINLNDINGGVRYENGDGVDAEVLNAVVEASAQAQNISKETQTFAKKLTDAPDVSQAGNVGTPNVEFVSNGNYYRFKFSNLKGQKGDTGAMPVVYSTNVIITKETTSISKSDVTDSSKVIINDILISNQGSNGVAKVTKVNTSDFTVEFLTNFTKTEGLVTSVDGLKGDVNLENKYAKQNGTYSEMVVGKATNADSASKAKDSEQLNGIPSSSYALASNTIKYLGVIDPNTALLDPKASFFYINNNTPNNPSGNGGFAISAGSGSQNYGQELYVDDLANLFVRAKQGDWLNWLKAITIDPTKLIPSIENGWTQGSLATNLSAFESGLYVVATTSISVSVVNNYSNNPLYDFIFITKGNGRANWKYSIGYQRYYFDSSGSSISGTRDAINGNYSNITAAILWFKKIG